MPFDCLFDFLRLNADVSLGNGCAAMLKELLYKDDVIVAVLINLRCIEFAEAMCADIAVPKISALISALIASASEEACAASSSHSCIFSMRCSNSLIDIVINLLFLSSK